MIQEHSNPSETLRRFGRSRRELPRFLNASSPCKEPIRFRSSTKPTRIRLMRSWCERPSNTEWVILRNGDVRDRGRSTSTLQNALTFLTWRFSEVSLQSGYMTLLSDKRTKRKAVALSSMYDNPVSRQRRTLNSKTSLHRTGACTLKRSWTSLLFRIGNLFVHRSDQSGTEKWSSDPLARTARPHAERSA